MNKLLTFANYFSKYAQISGESYGYEEDPAYTIAKSQLENPALLNSFYEQYPNDVITLAKYVDSNSRI